MLCLLPSIHLTFRDEKSPPTQNCLRKPGSTRLHHSRVIISHRDPMWDIFAYKKTNEPIFKCRFKCKTYTYIDMDPMDIFRKLSHLREPFWLHGSSSHPAMASRKRFCWSSQDAFVAPELWAKQWRIWSKMSGRQREKLDVRTKLTWGKWEWNFKVPTCMNQRPNLFDPFSFIWGFQKKNGQESRVKIMGGVFLVFFV